jgi:hypothetical protein
VELVDDPSFGPAVSQLLESGSDVWNVVAGAQAHHIATTDDESPAAEACDALDEFVDTARDYGEISADLIERRSSVRQAQRHLGELLSAMQWTVWWCMAAASGGSFVVACCRLRIGGKRILPCCEQTRS